VGNLERYQGVQVLLEGFRTMADRQPAQLVIIGGSPAHIDQYQRKVRDWGLSDRIHFLGPRPMADLGWYLGQANVLASPRITGTNTPMKIYSYLDSGTAVLATRLPTHTQVLDDSIACLVKPTADGVADGLVRLLSEPHLRTELARNAKQRVRQKYSREAFERKVHAFYDDVEARLATADLVNR
jgi:glycosyltransferase involved in cell wall biosynthesis